MSWSSPLAMTESTTGSEAKNSIRGLGGRRGHDVDVLHDLLKPRRSDPAIFGPATPLNPLIFSRGAPVFCRRSRWELALDFLR